MLRVSAESAIVLIPSTAVLGVARMEQVNPPIDLSAYPRLKSVERLSPFRYPGGKAFLAGFLADAISALQVRSATYAEPFCGGAGAALALLGQKKVSRVYLNDKDIRIYSAWRAIIEENEQFLTKLRNTPVTLDTWKKYRSVITNCGEEYSFELGFATFFINRTSRSGIIQASGPIGGYDQKGGWKINARYNKKTLEHRIKRIGTLAEKIKLRNLDGLEFLKHYSKSLDEKSTFYFVDPPYVGAGSRLYYNEMNDQLHHKLARFLNSKTSLHWVLTYDNVPQIQEQYKNMTINYLPVNYSLRNARKDSELLIHKKIISKSDYRNNSLA